MATWKKVLTEGNVSQVNLDVAAVDAGSTGTYSGETIEYGSMASGVTYTAGSIYVLTGSGWATPDISSPGNVNLINGLLGVAIGTGPTNGGFLLNGIVKVGSISAGGVTQADGQPVYIADNTTPRGFSIAAPTSAGNYLRIVGHMLDESPSTGVATVRFNPSNDYILIE